MNSNNSKKVPLWAKKGGWTKRYLGLSGAIKTICPSISPLEILFIEELDCYRNQTKTYAYPTLKALTSIMKWNKGTISDAAKRLEKRGLIVIRKMRSNRSEHMVNVYDLAPLIDKLKVLEASLGPILSDISEKHIALKQIEASDQEI